MSTFEEDKREMSQNAPRGAPPNRISSEEVFVSCAAHPSHVETGEGRGNEQKGKEKGKGKGKAQRNGDRITPIRRSRWQGANGTSTAGYKILQICDWYQRSTIPIDKTERDI